MRKNLLNVVLIIVTAEIMSHSGFGFSSIQFWCVLAIIVTLIMNNQNIGWFRKRKS